MRTTRSPAARIIGRSTAMSAAVFAIAMIGFLVSPPPGAPGATPPAAAPSPSAGNQTYVYWSFWTGRDSTWESSSDGPSGTRPTDGSVQGWRYGPGPEPGGAGAPRVAPDFRSACAGTQIGDGFTRVAVIIDFGPDSIAPNGSKPPGPVIACARIATGSNGLQALSAVATVRQDTNGMVCGINGYPTAGCSALVSTAAVMAPDPAHVIATYGSSPTAATGNSWVPFAGTVAVAVLLMAGSILIGRRRHV